MASGSEKRSGGVNTARKGKSKASKRKLPSFGNTAGSDVPF